jgi:hypothetical protein
MALIQIQELNNQIIFIRELYRNRNITIPANSLLENTLIEVSKFVSSTKDLRSLATANETDTQAVGIAKQILDFWHLADSIAILIKVRAKHMQETLVKLSEFQTSNPEHSEQWNETKYEVICAADFSQGGLRPSFVDTSRVSRFNKKVEFILCYKWPVECKRPRVTNRIIDRILDARTKIDERNQPGIIAVSLENALDTNEVFREIENETKLIATISSEFSDYLKNTKQDILSKCFSENVKAILFHYLVGAYCHDSESISMPLLRCALTRNGEFVNIHVMAMLSDLLRGI